MNLLVVKFFRLTVTAAIFGPNTLLTAVFSNFSLQDRKRTFVVLHSLPAIMPALLWSVRSKRYLLLARDTRI
jgi:hypothetical protein